MTKKILLLGSGELGKEFVIAAQRIGQTVIAVDSYENAPAMQVAHHFEVINMLDGAELDRIVAQHQPDFIVPEIEAIRTERFYDYEKQGITVVPSAKAANFTMNRKAIRDLAAKELGVRTAPYQYATSLEELRAGVAFCGLPCVVKPLMSSSGKGQSTVRTNDDVARAWTYAMEGSRGDLREVIIEEFCFSTPRIIMHMCLASITTATPSAPVTCITASAIWRLRFSWICRRRAYMSTIRATFDRPSTLPLGMYATCALPMNGSRWCSHNEYNSMSLTSTISLLSELNKAPLVTSSSVCS